MARLLFGLVVIATIFVIYAVADCAFFDRTRIRGVPKSVWIVVILLVPVLGAVLWFTVGRGRLSRVVPPDDDAEFLRQLEQEFSKPDTPDDGGPTGRPNG